MLTDTQTWGNYASPLPSILEATWGLAVPLPEIDKEYGRLISGIIYDWHRTGRLLALAKKWEIPASPWAVAEHDKLKIAE
jgi:polar amino acid transport system substrate-binding protein